MHNVKENYVILTISKTLIQKKYLNLSILKWNLLTFF